jgi:hypothetical protein
MEENKSNSKIKYPHFISNKPSGIDRYTGKSQERLSKAIANYITSTDNESGIGLVSRIIGLEGQWGAGKSNVIKQIEQTLSEKYYVFEYDAWGHQEDLQRRSFLETLTNNLIKNNFLSGDTLVLLNGNETKTTWEMKFKDLLAHKITRINKTLPKFNAGAFWTALFLSLTPISTFIAERLEANCIIKNIFLLVLIAFSPIMLGIILWGTLCLFNKDMRHLGFLLQISKDENIETKNYETINEEEPTVAKFNAWMLDISNYIKQKSLKKLIVIFDNMDRLPSEKVKELWSSIHTFFSDSEFENIWTIIPFDEKHLSKAFGENQADDLTKHFISKTFPVVYRVALPVITDFKSIFTEFFVEAFDSIESSSEDIINRLFRIENHDATVRKIIDFINQLVALKTIWTTEIDILYIAIFILKKDELLKDSVNQILSGNYLDENIKKIIENNGVLQTNIAALVYGINPDEAGQIPISKYIEACLKNESGHDINTYSRTNNHFIEILKDKIYELDNAELDNAIKTMSSLDVMEFGDVDKKTILNMWHYLSKQKTSDHITLLKFEEVFKSLLLNVDHEHQKDIISFLCCEYQNVKMFKNFNGNEYYIAIKSLQNFLKEKNIGINLELNDIFADPIVFIDYVNEAKNEYQNYKLKTNQAGLDKYFTGLIPDKLPDTKIDILQYLKNTDDYSFPELQKNIESIIKGNSINQNNFGDIFYVYKAIIKSDGMLPQQLSVNQITNLWNGFTPTIKGYCDIAAMQVAKSNNINPTLDEKQIKEVSESMDYYADYGDLLIKSLSVNIPVLNLTLKYMTENRLGYILTLEKILPQFFNIKNKIAITEKCLLEQLNDWEKHKDAINKDNIESIIPKELFPFLISVKNDLTDYINKVATEALSEITTDELYRQRNNIAVFYWFAAADSLIGTEFMGQLTDNLTSFGKKVLDDIASGQQEVSNNSLFKKIIDKLDKRKTSGMIKDIKNKYCNNEYNIYPALFLFFETWFEQQGDLEDRADRVVSTILQPVLNDNTCFNHILLKPDFYSKIINKAGDDAIDLKEIIRKKLEATKDEKLIAFAKKIGINKINNTDVNTLE